MRHTPQLMRDRLVRAFRLMQQMGLRARSNVTVEVGTLIAGEQAKRFESKAPPLGYAYALHSADAIQSQKDFWIDFGVMDPKSPEESATRIGHMVCAALAANCIRHDWDCSGYTRIRVVVPIPRAKGGRAHASTQ